MWAIRKGKPPLPAFVATVVCLATLNSTAQQQPVTIEHADLWGHYIRPLRMIHTPDAEARQFDAAVVLEVIVSVGGNSSLRRKRSSAIANLSPSSKMESRFARSSKTGCRLFPLSSGQKNRFRSPRLKT